MLEKRADERPENECDAVIPNTLTICLICISYHSNFINSVLFSHHLQTYQCKSGTELAICLISIIFHFNLSPLGNFLS